MQSRRTFLQELAADIHQNHPHLAEVTLVFPNRRAILYFRQYLSELLDRPVFPPRMITIEDYVAGFSDLRIPDRLEQVYQLHSVYQRIVQSDAEPQDGFGGLDQFYFWGDMLLRDFDEIDKHLVNVDLLFKDLSHQKELDANFDYLTQEQREFLKGFWSNFDVDQSANKRRFLYLWRKLADVYHGFTQVLREQKLAYEGMLYRDAAVMAEQDQLPMSKGSLHFAGFNALTTAEEKIIARAVLHGATLHWDIDAYYVNNVRQEAGRFFREYQEHPVFRKTFPHDIPSHGLLKGADDGKKKYPQITLFGAPQPIGQAKLFAQVLTARLAEGMKPEETLIVLPDEKLLLPVLHGIAGRVESMNVTMGFPLSSTPVFNFIEMLVDLQIARKDVYFNHKQVLALLGHPYVVAADAASASAKRKEIVHRDWVSVPESFLATEVAMHREIFRPFRQGDGPMLSALIAYFQRVLRELGQLRHLGDLDREYAAHFAKFFNRLEEVLSRNRRTDTEDRDTVYQLKSFLRLFRQLVRSEKLPFIGEPLQGLQVMGVLETRNLDFRNVFILSMNEGAFPAFASPGSYIPYSIRKAYRLPTPEHHDAIYAYLFYRVMQRAEHVSLFYNSETDVLGQGEMSRYLQQLLFESGIPVEKKLLYNPISPQQIQPITVSKGPSVKESLLRLNDGYRKFRGISPSALNTYLECRLKFYFRHIARIKEAAEVEEELDARVLGNFVHQVMELFYKDLAARKGSREINKSDYAGHEKTIDRLIDDVFKKAYYLDPDKPVEYNGQRLVVREIVRRFAHRVIEVDQDYAPFTIEGLEQEDLVLNLTISKPPFQAVIGGKIDRVDRKNDLVRVIDYKTGKDKMNFESVASLFVRDAGRNKAAFQTILYALLYSENSSGSPDLRVVPGLFNRVNLFDDFTFGLKLGRDEVEDIRPLLSEFKAKLIALLEELYDPDISFDQTGDLENCRVCPYSQICYR